MVQAAAGADSDEYCMAMGERAAVAGEYAAFWKAHTVGAQAHTQLGWCLWRRCRMCSAAKQSLLLSQFLLLKAFFVMFESELVNPHNPLIPKHNCDSSTCCCQVFYIPTVFER